jgi:acyl-CoA synthetase (AMP-forming)/AMP-acid ligase II
MREKDCMLVREPMNADGWIERVPNEGKGKPVDTGKSAGDGLGKEIRTVMFTSGSTGTPKGVCLSEKNILSAAEMMATFLELDHSRQTLVTLPMYDYYGYIQIFSHIMRGGGCVYGESTAFPGTMKQVLEHGNITDLALVPYSIRQLFQLLSRDNSLASSSFHTITSSSDLLTEDILEDVFRIRPDLTLYNIYGLTEAGRACYRKITADSDFSRSIGVPSPGVDILIDGTAERPGEILIRGPNVAAGYLHKIQNDEIVMQSCDVIETGDIGYRDENGEILLVGRKDHMISVMGEKIHPIEIESLAMCIPSVKDAIAEPVSDAMGAVRIRLSLVCQDYENFRDQLDTLFREHLERVFIPAEIRVVEVIERTELGAKLVRSKVNT